MKYKQKRKLGKVICNNCNIEFEKPLSEIKRNLEKGRPNYCSRSCVAKKNNKNKVRSINSYDISKHSKKPKKNWNKFSYIFRSVRRRFKDYDITLQDLKEQWEKQKGICPYSKIELTLPTNSNTNFDIRYRASLDRIDSSKGYMKDNIQFVSTAINYMKSTISHEDTVDFLNQISKNIS